MKTILCSSVFGMAGLFTSHLSCARKVDHDESNVSVRKVKNCLDIGSFRFPGKEFPIDWS